MAAWLALLLSLLSCAWADIPGDGPSLGVERDTLIPANDTLSMDCWGNRSVEWVWPKYQNSIENRIAISVCSHGPFCERLIVTKVTSIDSGTYKCFYGDDQATSSVYIYVQDDQSPFVPYISKNNNVVYITDNKTVTIPCLGSVPNLNVTLRTKNPESEFIPDGVKISWHSQKGFTIPGNLVKHAGTLYCNTIIDGKSLSSLMYYPTIIGYMIHEVQLKPYPVVERAVGDQLVLTCTARTAFNVRVDFSLDYPLAKEKHLEGSDDTRKEFVDGLEFSKTFVVNSVTLGHKGTYTCITYSGRMTKNVSSNVIVYGNGSLHLCLYICYVL